MENKFVQDEDDGTSHECEYDEANDAAESSHNSVESSHYVDFHAINSLINMYNCNMTGLEADPMFVEVKIND